MVADSPLQSITLFHVGPVPVTEMVVTTWGIIVVLGGLCWWSSRRLELRPSGWQALLELVVETIEHQIEEIVGEDPRSYVGLLGTLFIYLVVANLVELIPGLRSPTAHLETPAALAGIVFLSVHVFGVRERGILGYLKSYARPNILLLPLNVISEITRTFSLMVRLFGNIMSHGIIIAIVITLAGLLVPVPLMALSIVIGVVQAYIFAILATVFVGAAVSGEKL